MAQFGKLETESQLGQSNLNCPRMLPGDFAQLAKMVPEALMWELGNSGNLILTELQAQDLLHRLIGYRKHPGFGTDKYSGSGVTGEMMCTQQKLGQIIIRYLQGSLGLPVDPQEDSPPVVTHMTVDPSMRILVWKRWPNEVNTDVPSAERQSEDRTFPWLEAHALPLPRKGEPYFVWQGSIKLISTNVVTSIIGEPTPTRVEVQTAHSHCLIYLSASAPPA